VRGAGLGAAMTIVAKARKTFRPLYWRVASLLPVPARRRFLFLARHRRWPDLRDPHGFSEKINWRILHDRRQMLVDFSDKLEMRRLARERVPDPAMMRLPELLWQGDSLEDLPDLQAVGPWVLKPNNGTGTVVFGPDGRSREEIIRRAQAWRSSAPGELLGEWAYTQIPTRYLLEGRLPGGGTPADYKLLCFDGEPRVIQVHTERFSDAHSLCHYTPEWELLPGRSAKWRNDPVPRPERLDLMLEIARRLSAGWDFIRIDLYDVDGAVWFGEFSPYPGAGTSRFVPYAFDEYLGSLWTLPEHLR